MSDKLNLERDLKEAEDMAEGLKNYVRGDQLYGSIRGGLFGSGNAPSLTIGALLLRLHRLNALADRLTETQRQAAANAESQRAAIQNEWTLHYNEKVLREINSRLDSMKAYFEECAQDPKLCANAYLPEAARRTIIEALVQALSADQLTDELKAKLQKTDGGLRRYVQKSDFVWAAELAAIYPNDTYWWLYQRPPQVEK
jgi:hypothetical protein